MTKKILRGIRGFRDPIQTGHIAGRLDPKDGDVQQIPVEDIAGIVTIIQVGGSPRTPAGGYSPGNPGGTPQEILLAGLSPAMLARAWIGY